MYTIGQDGLSILDGYGFKMAVAEDVWRAREIVDALNHEYFDDDGFERWGQPAAYFIVNLPRTIEQTAQEEKHP